MFALAVSADDTLFLVCSLPLLCPLVPVGGPYPECQPVVPAHMEQTAI